MRQAPRIMKNLKRVVAAVIVVTSFLVISAPDSTVLACSRSGNSGGPNPDTGGALDGNYQFVKTDSSVTVLAISYGTNTVGTAPSGGNVWSNNGTWGNVQVGGSIKSESSGNIYYPPGCSPTTTTTTTTTTTLPPTTTSTTSTTTTTTIPKTTTTSTTVAPKVTTTVQPTSSTVVISGQVTTTTMAVVVDDGVEEGEVVADISLQKSGNSYMIRVTSNREKTQMQIIARKKGSKNIVWTLTTDGNGAKGILTSRNLKGFTLALRVDGETVDTAKVS